MKELTKKQYFGIILIAFAGILASVLLNSQSIFLVSMIVMAIASGMGMLSKPDFKRRKNKDK